MNDKYMPIVDIVIVNYVNSSDTIECIDSLKKITYPINKIIVVDNTNTTDDKLQNYIRSSPIITYVRAYKNLGFGGGVNIGTKEALKDNPDYILLLNNDTIVAKDFLNSLIHDAAEENAALATGKIYYYTKPDIIWGAGGWIDWKRGMGMLYGIGQKDVGQFGKNKKVSFISGCMMLIKSDVFGKIGMFDEKYFMYYEDVDFCIRASRGGYSTIYVPRSIIWHKVGATNVGKTPFYFYYFLRNSIFIVTSYAKPVEKLKFLLYAPVYFFLKLATLLRKDVEFIKAFFLGIKDGLSGKSGEGEYEFLQREKKNLSHPTPVNTKESDAKKTRKMLFITNLLPYPLDNGGKIKTYNALCVLKTLYDIDMLCFIDRKSDINYRAVIEKMGINVECIYKKIKYLTNPFSSVIEIFKSIFSPYPYIVLKYYSALMKAKIADKIFNLRYEKIYIDHLPLFQYLPSYILGKKDESVVLDEHNVESDIVIRRLKNEKNVINRIFLTQEKNKIVDYEKRACAAAGLTLAISANDRDKIIKMSGGKCNCAVAPLFISNTNNIYDANSAEKRILFLGTMSWYPNEDGALWFYNNVFKTHEFGKAGWKFTIVGSDPSPSIRKLKSDASVEVVGYVEDIKPYLTKTLVSVVPLKIGGGIRIKILELLSFGIPVISTTIGCEGIPVEQGKHILIADSAKEFDGALRSITADSTLRLALSMNGSEFIAKNYSYSSALRIYSELLQSRR